MSFHALFDSLDSWLSFLSQYRFLFEVFSFTGLTMAEVVQRNIELMLDELEEIKAAGLMSEEEIQ